MPLHILSIRELEEFESSLTALQMLRAPIRIELARAETHKNIFELLEKTPAFGWQESYEEIDDVSEEAVTDKMIPNPLWIRWSVGVAAFGLLAAIVIPRIGTALPDSEDTLHAAAPVPTILQALCAAQTGRKPAACYRSSFLGIAGRTLRPGSVQAPALFDQSFSPSSLNDGTSKVGVYLSSTSAAREDFLDQTLDALTQEHGTALIFEVKGGMAFFKTNAAIAIQHDLVKPIEDLPAIVAKAHARGIYTIARFGVANDSLLAMRLPATQIRSPKTGVSIGALWVDVGNPETIEYDRQLLRDVLLAGLDEVNFDYIRYPTSYRQEMIGLSGQEKADHIEAFIRMARETVDAIRPQTKIGLSTFAILGWDYQRNVEAIGQDVVRFAPLVDIIAPMAYPSSFTDLNFYAPGRDLRSRTYWLVYRTLTGYQALLGPEQSKKLRPWIQGYFLTPKDMSEEIDAVYDAGLCGYTVWNADNAYGVTYRAMSMNTNRPARCNE